jgi:Fic family protein
MSAPKKKSKNKPVKGGSKRSAAGKRRNAGRAAARKPPKPKAKPRPSARPTGKAPKSAAQKKQAALRDKREREKLAKARAAEKKQREREKAQALKEREREKAQKERERAAAEKQREREKAQKERERIAALKQREAEKARAKKEALAKKAAEKAEKEAEKKRLIAEREAAKEAARKAKEEERARREAERDAYRKAKEAERERLRAEKEAARRLREGKVARASRAQQRVDGLRVGTTRVYDPAAIPNQSGTTRRAANYFGPTRLVGVRPAEPGSVPSSQFVPEHRPTPPPQPPPPVQEGVEIRYQRILERLERAGEGLKKEYESTLEMSWIHHDSALEGVVYTFQELTTAMDPSAAAPADSSMQPVCDEIRRHRQAIAYVRDLGERKRVPLNVDVVKKLFVMLHPEEGDVKTVKYRKDIPQHRLYFHEYAPPDKIAYRVRQIMDWLNGPEAKKMKSPLRVGARVHYDLVRVFPFAQDSGKVARLLMNIILLRGGYPPAIVHSTERQRYYEALKGQLPVILQLVNESISNALASIEKRLDEHESRGTGAAAS